MNQQVYDKLIKVGVDHDRAQRLASIEDITARQEALKKGQERALESASRHEKASDPRMSQAFDLAQAYEEAAEIND